MITGKLTMGRDGAISMQFDQDVTVLPGQTYAVTLTPAPDLHELRAVRLHHWRQVCWLADRICDKRASRHTLADYRVRHATHMRAVQALNDLFPLGDTAERDMQAEDAANRKKL